MLFLPGLHHAPTPMLVKPSPQLHMSSYAMMLSRPPSSNPMMARTKCSSVSPSILPLILKGVRTLCLSTALNRPTSTARLTSFHHPPPPPSPPPPPPPPSTTTLSSQVRYSPAPTPSPTLHYYTELPSPLQCCLAQPGQDVVFTGRSTLPTLFHNVGTGGGVM